MQKRPESYNFDELKNLFGGQFHNAWPEEYTSWENAIDDYIERNPVELLELISKTLTPIVLAHSTEEELERIVDDELMANFYPPGVGYTYQVWLEMVLDRLDTEIKSKRHALDS